MNKLLMAGDGGTARRAAPRHAALAKGRILPARAIRVSTSGVYGDCGVELVAERAGLPRPMEAR